MRFYITFKLYLTPFHPSFPIRHGISRVCPPFLRSLTCDRRAARRRPHAKLRRLGSSTGGFVVGPFADRTHARLTLLSPLSRCLRRARSAGRRQFARAAPPDGFGRSRRTHARLTRLPPLFVTGTSCPQRGPSARSVRSRARRRRMSFFVRARGASPHTPSSLSVFFCRCVPRSCS